jgi:hypothetical protein
MYIKFAKTALIATPLVGLLTLAPSSVQAQNSGVEQILYAINQDLMINKNTIDTMCYGLRDEISCIGAKGNACTITIVHIANLQDLINQGALSPQDSAYQQVLYNIGELRDYAGCAS